MRNIKVLEHDFNWKKIFQIEKEKLENTLKDNIIKIFHIGSTSVEDLLAKPVIDILLVVKNIDKLDNYNIEFEKLGYEVMGEYGIENRRFYKKGGEDNRSHHIHAFQYDNINEIERHLLFRDYLRINKKARGEYGKLKAELSVKFPNDIDGYCDGKDELVKAIERDALIWHWKNR